MPEIGRSSKKTDEHDVEAMVNRLLVSGELPESYRATRSERELRGLTRRLSGLRRDKQRVLNRIHAVIDCHGMPAGKSRFDKEDWRADIKGSVGVACAGGPMCRAWGLMHGLVETR